MQPRDAPAPQQKSWSDCMRVPMSVQRVTVAFTAMSLSLVRCVVQAQAEQHANELLNQWSSAKKALLAASG